MYRVCYTLNNGNVHLLPDWFDEEWAGRIARQLRQCPDVALVEVVEIDFLIRRKAA